MERHIVSIQEHRANKPIRYDRDFWAIIRNRIELAKELYETKVPEEIRKEWHEMSPEEWLTISDEKADRVIAFTMELYDQTQELYGGSQTESSKSSSLSLDDKFLDHLAIMEDAEATFYAKSTKFQQLYSPGTSTGFRRLLTWSHDLSRIEGYNGAIPLDITDKTNHLLMQQYFGKLADVVYQFLPDASIIGGEGPFPDDTLINFWKLLDTVGKPPGEDKQLRYPEPFLSPGGGHEQWQAAAIKRGAFPFYVAVEGATHGFWEVTGEHYGQRDREWTLKAYNMIRQQFPTIDFDEVLRDAVEKIGSQVKKEDPEKVSAVVG